MHDGNLNIAASVNAAHSVLMEGPEPLRRSIKPAAPFPMKHLGPLLGDAGARLHAVVKAPDAICGSSVLAAASLAVQGLANVEIDGRRYPLSLWCITVAESGERKSAVDALALQAHVEFERERVQTHRDEMKRYAIELAAHEEAVKSAKASHKGTKGDAKRSRQQFMQVLEDVGAPPDMPLIPNLLCSEPTLEGLHKLLQNGHPSLGVFTDEAGQLFGGHAMNKDNVAKSAAGMSKLWDGAAIDRIRAGDGASKMYGKRLAMHALMQPVIAEMVLANETLVGQGFLARGLMAWPAGTAGSRIYDSTNLCSDPAMQAYWEGMRRLLETAPPLLPDTRNELAPRALQLTPEAKEFWVGTANAIEALNGPEGDYARVKPWASKAAEQIARIAGVLTLVEDSGANQIPKPAIVAAANLMEWFLDEANRLVGSATTSPEIKNAEAIRDWCKANGKEFVHSSELLQKGPSAIREARTLHASMTELERAGWALLIKDGMELEGTHRRKVWRMYWEAD